MSAPHNCVGGSEQGCIPEHPPVGNPALTGSGSTVPAPAHWYANGNDFSVASGQKLGAGPEMYNNMAAPNNCVGGSETSCPATVPVAPAPPAHWYATGNDFSVASGQKLGAGPEMYNSMSAPHNCVGGSEQGCIPEHPPVGNPALTGSGSTVPPPASWYANGDAPAMAPSKALVLPLAAPTMEMQSQRTVSKPTPGHLVMACHSFTLAAIQGVFKGDFTSFKEDAAENAQAVTPVGALMVRNITA